MDLSSPISSVVPSAHGAVLAVLARTDTLLSGRQIAALTGGRFSQSRVNAVLGELTRAGIVWREERPPAMAYRLQRDHVAADGIIALARQWEVLISRIRDAIAGWHDAAEAAWIFGSAARGDGGPDSDIDLLVVRPDEFKGREYRRTHDPNVLSQWERQVAELEMDVLAWSGNVGEVLDLSVTEFRRAVEQDDRLVRDLRDHGIPLTGGRTRALLGAEVSK